MLPPGGLGSVEGPCPSAVAEVGVTCGLRWAHQQLSLARSSVLSCRLLKAARRKLSVGPPSDEWWGPQDVTQRWGACLDLGLVHFLLGPSMRSRRTEPGHRTLALCNSHTHPFGASLPQHPQGCDALSTAAFPECFMAAGGAHPRRRNGLSVWKSSVCPGLRGNFASAQAWPFLAGVTGPGLVAVGGVTAF